MIKETAEQTQSIISQYPVRNRAWTIDDVTGNFGAEAASLGLVWQDPWNRPLGRDRFTPEKDGEGEILLWKGTTTVNGTPVTLIIYND